MLGELLSQALEKFWEYLKFWQVIDAFEKGALCRWGVFKKVLHPGFHWKWPFADYVFSAITTPDTIDLRPFTLTTNDGKTISIGAVVEFEIEDVVKYLIDTNDARSNMHDICLGIISDDIEDRDWEEIKKKTTKNSVQRKITTACKEMGISVIGFHFTTKAVTRSFSLIRE